MKESRYMPQNSKFVAILLAFIGGFIDVYCHIQFHTFVATQTGNIILSIADIGSAKLDTFMIRLLSLAIFTIGFVAGIVSQKKAKSAYWRTYTMIPLFLSCLLTPFLPLGINGSVIVLAFSCGMLMVTFSDSMIEDHPYMIMMTSGNYRKMITAWYDFFMAEKRTSEIKRRAIDYTIIVFVFIFGALCCAFAYHFMHVYSIIVTAVAMGMIMIYYHLSVKRNHLQETNI